MRLKRVLIENFRGVRRLDLTLDQTTVLISENHHGKTTVLDALGLCLGLRGSDTETCFREGDCFSPEGGSADSVRIVLTFEASGGDPDHTEQGPSGPDDSNRTVADDDPSSLGPGPVHLEFSGALPDRQIHRRFVDDEGLPLDPQPDPSDMDRIQRAHPVLMLRFARPRHEAHPIDPSDDAGIPDSASTPNRRGPGDLAATIAHVYQELSLQRGPVSEDHLSRGLAAAHRLLEEAESDAAPAAPVHRMLGDLRAEVRRWGRPPAADASLNLSGSGSHNLALLLVLGSILAVRGETGLDEEAWPVIAIEDPEAHLHPILLASTQRVIEALRAQTIVTTNSGELISSVRLSQLRRLVPSERAIDVYRLRKGSLTPKDMRRVAYHIRAKRGGVLFARC